MHVESIQSSKIGGKWSVKTLFCKEVKEVLLDGLHVRLQNRKQFSVIMTAQGSPAKMKELRLPMSRVKTIMKSSPYVDTIGQDGLYLVTKATELFIHYLTEEAHQQNNKGNSLDYKHLAEVVQTNDTLEFLKEIMPRKITVRQFKEMMAAKNSHSSSSESSSDSDSDSESETDSYTDSDDRKDNESKENGKCESASDKSDSDDDSKR